MDARELAARLGAWGVIPVVSIDDAGDAVALATALAEGGLPVIGARGRVPRAAAPPARDPTPGSSVPRSSTTPRDGPGRSGKC